MGYFSEIDIENQNKMNEKLDEEARAWFANDLARQQEKAQKDNEMLIIQKFKEDSFRKDRRERLASRLSKDKTFLTTKKVKNKRIVASKKAKLWGYKENTKFHWILSTTELERVLDLAIYYIDNPRERPNFKSHHKASK